MDAVVERNVDLDASPAEVWRALTEPDELVAWFGPDVELDLRPGGRGRFVDDDGSARRAVVDEVHQGERLVLRWWPEGDDPGAGASVVTFVVAPTGSGTRLVVTERLVARASTASLQAAAAAARTAWMWRLDLLLLRLAAVARV
jgi:uncharacterized protein YndB with AHSA1/START domain